MKRLVPEESLSSCEYTVEAVEALAARVGVVLPVGMRSMFGSDEEYMDAVLRNCVGATVVVKIGMAVA